MSVLQSKESELRFLKRKNLEEEARIQGGYYRDLIRAYGVDCNYYKLDTHNAFNYHNIVDRNAILQKAYGYVIDPDYHLSTTMITYCEVQNDVFDLQKIGLIPNTTVDFYFDATDFACSLAEKCGQLKEYPITSCAIECEIPEFNAKTSAEVYPYMLGLGYNENISCDVLSGKVKAILSSWTLEQQADLSAQQNTTSRETTLTLRMYEHGDVLISFPSNKDLYKSFKYKLSNSEYVDNLLYLTYSIRKVQVRPKKFKYFLQGIVHGSILFYDIKSLSKYSDKLRPEVGDIVTIDFPNNQSREQYEITDCFDKSLQTDGISPLLHKYIWKCKARRYINNGEDMEYNEANAQNTEKIEFDNVIHEEIASKIGEYEDNEDAAYGEYDGIKTKYDKQEVDQNSLADKATYEYLDGATAIDILQFKDKTKLATDGYSLYFVTSEGAIKLAATAHSHPVNQSIFEQGLQFLAATDDMVVFKDIEGGTHKLVEDTLATQNEIEICLNSLFDMTYDTKGNPNKNGDQFYKFKNTRTVLFSHDSHLFCRLATKSALYKLC